MNEPHGSGSTDDIYDDLDSLFNPEADCVSESEQESPSTISDFTKTGIATVNLPSQSSSTSNFDLNEDQLKKEEVLLYLDLVVTELGNKKALSKLKTAYINLKTAYINLKRENVGLKKSLSEKDDKIATLKNNISTLFKTAKSEIDQKDAMLQEAHRQLDKRFSHSGKSTFQNERRSAESSQYQPSTSRMSNVSTQDIKQQEAHFDNKEDQRHKDNKQRSYETSKSENPSFTRPSTSFKPSENRFKWNRVNSRQRFRQWDSAKYKHLPTHGTVNKKCNTYNFKDRRKHYDKLKNSKTSPSKERSSKRQRRCS